jgi:hypothetical protein
MVILGKSNLSEWASFRGFNSTSGRSGVGGLTHNPYVLDRSPCGSSSGSGAAPSANLPVCVRENRRPPHRKGQKPPKQKPPHEHPPAVRI